jgi:hypothetical protein
MPEKERDTVDERVAGHSGELRKYALDEVEEIDHRDVSHAAGLVDDQEVLDLLSFAEAAYRKRKSPGDPPFHKTEWYKRRVRRYASRSATRAIDDGNVSQMSYLVGDPPYQNDVSGLHTARKLEEWLTHSEAAKLIYVAGLMGRGKTDLCCSFLEVVHWSFERIREEITEYGGETDDVPVPEFAANFEVEPAPDDVECIHCPSYDDLLDWVPEDASSRDVRWFLFDEASTELTAQSGKNAQDVAEIFAPFVKKMRKLGVNLVVVGHDRGDVHIAIRSMADFVAKPGLKKASVYAGINKREPQGHMFDLDQIPQTTWSFDTDDMATWDWGSARQDEEIEGYDEQDTKRLTAIHAAEVYQVSDLSMAEACEAVSTPSISVSTTMLQDALDGRYQEVIA